MSDMAKVAIAVPIATHFMVLSDALRITSRITIPTSGKNVRSDKMPILSPKTELVSSLL
jgi:hypothetical protein